MASRAATDTIRGYFYQFDYSIKKLLELDNSDSTVTIEGIEDIDISTATENSAIQCKYYAKSEYNHSVIAKPIRLMLSHFKELRDSDKPTINYHLYGHYNSGQEKLNLPVDLDFLKDKFLTYKKDKIIHYHHDELSLSDSCLESFLGLLKIDIGGEKYEDQFNSILALLKSQFNCSDFEAEHFYYNNSLKFIKEVAVKEITKDRVISYNYFINSINFKEILFHNWFTEFKGEQQFFRTLRSEYFSNLNISPFERFFLIEFNSVNQQRSDLLDSLFLISKKFSQLSKRAKCFCPYIYIHGIREDELIEIKKELQASNFKFIDGFDFEGASFNEESICKPATYENQIRLKFVNNILQLSRLLGQILKTKEIYQFYFESSFFEYSYDNAKHVRLQIRKLTNLKDII
ncbi:MAG: DUF4297 family anti-phage-associated protein [Reichenbachiella sp.]|uniref:DUF4297 family anti-phage-associated protein n=1 Tax=Reichenbachiella sp. TaxID=2184521 RepID=UPI003263B8FC